MDLLISPRHFFGILAEYDFHLEQASRVFEMPLHFEGTLHLDVDRPGKPYSLITIQMRDEKIIYNKILEWKLATHYSLPPKVIKLLRDRAEQSPT